ncbi:MAG: bifunctional diaminohydroxyphosphoribosylaminopyrimidine deaminase/5-amino-6-(5-phosphoribosylamino)uracil reductase RibD [Nitrospirota bacterium]
MLSLTVRDELLMRKALRLAARARGRTSPNPMVGAVLTRGGQVVAEDFHRRAGSPHAEALVLEKAGQRARGSTLYVTLEPCSHLDKKTPPCADAIIRAGVARVVVAMVDPNPRVRGEGVRKLGEAGIEVQTGLLEEKARALNEAYEKFITTGLPFVILKTAMTLDGKIATPEGESKWITGEPARRLVHRVRDEVDAILTGIGTVRADDPELTARVPGGEDPLRVIVDPNLEVSPDARVLRTPPPTLLVTRNRGEKARGLETRGIELLFFQGRLSLRWLIEELGRRNIVSVLIEAGSSLNASAFEEEIVDKAMVFVAPTVIGGRTAFTPVGGSSFRRLGEACRLDRLQVRRVGEDILIQGRVSYPPRMSKASPPASPGSARP